MKKNILSIILLSLFLICSSHSIGQTNYYFAFESGSDSGNGTIENPYKTFTKLESLSLYPGDSVFFKKGEVLRIPDDQDLDILWSGNSEQFLYFGVYGNSQERPKILGSTKVISWRNEGNNIWSADLDYNPRSIGYGACLFCLENDDVSWSIFRKYENGKNELEFDLDWTWNDNTVYMYSTSNPETRFHSIEAPFIESPISLGRQEYLHFDSLEVVFFIARGIGETYTPENVCGLRITNCHIHHSGYQNSATGYGLDLYHSDAYIANNNIHDNGRRNISLTSYNNTPTMSISNIVIENNYLHDGWHTTGVDLNTQGSHSYDSIIIRNNLFEDPMNFDFTNPKYNESMSSNHIFISHQGSDSKIKNVYVYNNIFYGHNGNGVLIGGGDGVENVHIVNNTFYGFNYTITGYYGFIVASKMKNLEVMNNIFHGNGDPEVERDLFCVSINDTLTLSSLEMDYNVHYQENKEERFFMLQNLKGNQLYYPYKMSEWSTFRSTFSNFENNGFGEIEPLFTNSSGKDFTLLPDCLFINLGVHIPWNIYDFYGEIRDPNNPTIGAIRYSEPDPSAAEILYFILEEQTGAAIIDRVSNNIDIEVKKNTILTSLIPIIIASPGASVSPASGISQDFSSPVNYLVTSGNNSTQKTWTVKVTVAKSSSINEKKAKRMLLYPNPAKEYVKLRFLENQTEKVSVRIYNQSNILVFNANDYTPIENEIEISLDNLKSGLYTLQAIIPQRKPIYANLIIEEK